jgi:hypothetical protein
MNHVISHLIIIMKKRKLQPSKIEGYIAHTT